MIYTSTYFCPLLETQVRLIITSAISYLLFHSLGFRGGDGGDNRGGGGYGGETFFCRVQEPNMGKGGDISGAAWATNKNGIGGGRAGDGPSSSIGKQSLRLIDNTELFGTT